MVEIKNKNKNWCVYNHMRVKLNFTLVMFKDTLLGALFHFSIEIEPKPVLEIIVHTLLRDLWIFKEQLLNWPNFYPKEKPISFFLT